MKKYVYYIVYFCTAHEGNSFFANSETEINSEIKTMGDLQAISEDAIKKISTLRGVSVNSAIAIWFTLLRTE